MTTSSVPAKNATICQPMSSGPEDAPDLGGASVPVSAISVQMPHGIESR
jgi:hypothetical protein